MRSNDEFLENVYKKRDVAVGKRNKKIAAAVSCTFAFVVAFVGATHVVPLLRCKTSTAEPSPVVKDIIESTVELFDGESYEQYHGTLDEAPMPEGPMVEDADGSYVHLTEIYTGGFGYDGETEEGVAEIYTEIALETGVFDDTVGAPTADVADSTRASYTEEQIVDAAYSSLSEAEKSAIVGKSSYMSMVSYEVNVGEFYEVWFDKTDGGYVKVKLSSPGLERVN